MTSIIGPVVSLGEFFQAIAGLMWHVAIFAVVLGIWAAAIIGAKVLFKNWRLYSPHPWAKRIRRWLTKRRQAARERAA